jgi:hypothetical protein
MAICCDCRISIPTKIREAITPNMPTISSQSFILVLSICRYPFVFEFDVEQATVKVDVRFGSKAASQNRLDISI